MKPGEPVFFRKVKELEEAISRERDSSGSHSRCIKIWRWEFVFSGENKAKGVIKEKNEPRVVGEKALDERGDVKL